MARPHRRGREGAPLRRHVDTGDRAGRRKVLCSRRRAEQGKAHVARLVAGSATETWAPGARRLELRIDRSKGDRLPVVVARSIGHHVEDAWTCIVVVPFRMCGARLDPSRFLEPHDPNRCQAAPARLFTLGSSGPGRFSRTVRRENRDERASCGADLRASISPRTWFQTYESKGGPTICRPCGSGGGVHRLGRTRSRPRRIAGEETEVPRRAGSFRRAVDPWVRSDRGSPFKRSVRGVKSPRFFRVRGAGTPIGGIEGHVPSRNLLRPPLPSSSGRGAWPPRRGGSEDPRTSRLVQTDAKCRADGEEGRICEMVPHFSTNADAKAVRFPNEWHAQTKGTAPGRSRHTRRRRRRQTSQTDPRR